jgi:prolyl-tRNA editing enzyme YbaK/EbsC (Cys-tRNA(Pro) deacylase)
VTEDLSRSAVRVQRALEAAGIASHVVELPRSTRTSVEAAAAIGCTVGQIAKSVVFRRVDTGVAVLVLLRGIDRVDTTVLARHVGSRVERASPEFVREVTGFVIGGVPPLGHATPVQTLMDEGLLQYAVVWAAAGTPNAVFSANPRDLARLASVVTVAEAGVRTSAGR